MVMQPPCKVAPVTVILLLISEPRNDDAGRGPHLSRIIQTVPDMACVVCFIACAVVPRFVAPAVYLLRAISGSNMDWPEGVDERIKQFGAQSFTRAYCSIWVFREVADTVEVADLRIQEIPHKEVLGQAGAPELFQLRHSFDMSQMGLFVISDTVVWLWYLWCITLVMRYYIIISNC